MTLRYERVLSGTWDLSTQRGEGAGFRFLRARRYLSELLSSQRVTALGYEEVRRHAGSQAAAVYGGIRGQILAVCEELHVPYAPFEVGDIKRTATGKGNASKDAMVDAAARRFGYTPADDNDADAMWIAACVAKRLGCAGTFVGIDPATRCGWAILRAVPE